MQKLKLSFDPVLYKQKPDENEIKFINNRITQKYLNWLWDLSCPKYTFFINSEDNVYKKEHYSIQELAYCIGQKGCTFVPAYFNENIRSTETWAGQQLYALDFDNTISIEEFFNRCNVYHIYPAFVYETFSSINENRFRTVFVHEFDVSDVRLRNLIQHSIMTLFPESCKNCRDAARIFFGGKKLINTNYDSVISVPDLMMALCSWLHNTFKKPARSIEQFCSQVGINIKNNYPYIELLKVSKNGSEYINYINSVNPKRTVSVYNNQYLISWAEDNAINNSNKLAYRGRSKIEKVKENKNVIQHYNFNKLKRDCQLFSEFLDGDRWCYHNELFGIMLNLLQIKGGKVKFEEGLKSRIEYADYGKVDSFDNFWNYSKNVYYAESCEKYCPYIDTCSRRGSNMVQQGQNKIGMIYTIEQPEWKDLDIAEKELVEVFNKYLQHPINNVSVIKGSTGIGKTELYINLNEKAIIGLPTHKLIKDVARRFKEVGLIEGKDFIVAPDIPIMENDDWNKLEKLYRMGAYGAANAFLSTLAKNNDRDDIREYQYIIKELNKVNTTILITHERLFSINNPNIELIIVDEDILKSILYIGTVKELDLMNVRFCDHHNTFRDIINEALECKEDLLNDNGNSCYSTKEVEKSLITNGGADSNVLGFLNCSCYIKKNNGYQNEYTFLKVRRLPLNKKIIVMSATTNKMIYERIFSDCQVEGFHYHDLGNVKTRGKIIQYPQKSFSRSAIRRNKKLVNLVNKLVPKGTPIITYKDKEFGDLFKVDDSVPAFGNVNGIDTLKGKDIAVVGTYHVNPIVYVLYGHYFGVNVNIEDINKMITYTTIKRNGFEFYFNTFPKNEVLREIQLYLVESELLQSIGRARILREEATVYVFSNLPVVGAEFRYFNKEEMESLIG